MHIDLDVSIVEELPDVVKDEENYPPFRHDFLLQLTVCIESSIIEEEIQKENRYMWLLYAVLSAFFAAVTSILAKIGIAGVNSHLATAIRTVVVLLLSWGMVFFTGQQHGIVDISKKSWMFLILSGLATGASWLCYYRALQMADASKVVPIDKMSVVITLIMAFVFLHETASAKMIIGAILITAGTLVMVL